MNQQAQNSTPQQQETPAPAPDTGQPKPDLSFDMAEKQALYEPGSMIDQPQGGAEAKPQVSVDDFNKVLEEQDRMKEELAQFRQREEMRNVAKKHDAPPTPENPTPPQQPQQPQQENTPPQQENAAPEQPSNPNPRYTEGQMDEIAQMKKEHAEALRKMDVFSTKTTHSLSPDQVSSMEQIMTQKGLNAEDALTYMRGMGQQQAVPTPDNPAAVNQMATPDERPMPNENTSDAELDQGMRDVVDGALTRGRL